MNQLVEEIKIFIEAHDNNKRMNFPLLEKTRNKNEYPIPPRNTLGRDYYKNIPELEFKIKLK